MAKVVYVAGYGRSGSTVLDVLLGSHPEVCSVGEVAFLAREAVGGRRCACGESYRRCSFWGGFLEGWAETPDVDRLRRVEARRNLVRLLRGREKAEDVARYREFNRALISHVLEASGCSVAVDSSKSGYLTAGRPLALSQLIEHEVYLLHLVRDGADTVSSYVRHGSNWAREGKTAPPRLPALRCCLGWILAHVSTLIVGRRIPAERRLRVSYADLLSAPDEVLSRIGQWLGLDYSEIGQRAAQGDFIEVGHNVGGNRLRKRDGIRLWRSGGNEPRASETALRHRVLFGVMGGWLQRWLSADTW